MTTPLTWDVLREQVTSTVATRRNWGNRPVRTEKVDTALIHSYSALLNRFPPVESTVEIETTGREQDVGALIDDLWTVQSLAYPWYSDAQFGDQLVETDVVAPNIYRFRDVIPQAGEELRVRYRRKYTIAGYEQATVTNLPTLYHHWFIQIAAAIFLEMIVGTGEITPEQRVALSASAAAMKDDAFEMIDALSGASQSTYVEWGDLGL